MSGQPRKLRVTVRASTALGTYPQGIYTIAEPHEAVAGKRITPSEATKVVGAKRGHYVADEDGQPGS